LFVTDITNAVKYYSTVDWTYQGSINIVVSGNPRYAVGIAFYDNGQGSKYLYTGSWSHNLYYNHNYLVRTNITDINSPSSTQKDVGASVLGITVDEDTGLVYATTFNNDIEVYDNATFPSDPCCTKTSGISGPAGIIVRGDVEYKPAHFLLTKDDNIPDVNCVLPDNYITYTIFYDANGHSDSNVIIVDHLPPEVDYNSSSPLGDYNAVERTVSWNLWTVLPDDNGTFTLTVQVNQLAEPLGTITNLCEIEGDSTYNVVEINTPVCAWNPGIIYVDTNAAGSNTGMSWDNAYRDLQDALNRAAAGCGSEIWVAAGTYKPTQNPSETTATFDLVSGVPIYGGFSGNETSRNQRNWLTNQTILTGDINNDGYRDVHYVVTALNVGYVTIIDGFTITKGDWSAIYCNGASPTIAHNTIRQNWWGIGCENNSLPVIIKACLIQDNADVGIGYANSVLTVTDCIIEDNNTFGIYGDVYGDVNSQLTVSNSIIRNGIYLVNMLSTTIKNNWIHNNGTYNYGDGIYIYNYHTQPPATIRNNTIVNNADYGIYRDYSAPEPNISNCIIWGNNNAGVQLYGCSASYSCIQNGNTNNHNIYIDPNFMNPDDPNDLHIGVNSLCKNAGDPYANYDGETDIDGEGRIKYSYVDIGGDEYYWSSADFNDDEFVNFIDYAIFANAWMSDPNDPNWNPNCDIATPDNNQIDYADLAVFCEDWLWQAGWTKTFTCGASQGMGQTMAAGFAPAAVSYPLVLSEQQIEKVEPLKIEQLIKWLEELWLDPEAQNLIDKDIWLKFIESLKEEI
jgi:hypothetical protein